jgi:sugar/nucleoside kinase (ribokinase family)
MYDICCIGHITLDKIIRPGSVVEMAGGTAYYFSNALRHMDLRYLLVTAVAGKEIRFVEQLASRGIEVKAFASERTVCFENIYEGHMDHRVQKVWQKSAAFSIQQLAGVNAAIFHLGPLLADDIPPGLIRDLSARGIVSLDVQGYLREVRDSDVHAIDWPLKKEILPYVDILKANEEEMQVLTGENDIRKGASVLADWGVKEVIITKGSKGSLILFSGVFHEIPAYIKGPAIDATGCGDTYMAGYLYQRAKGALPQRAGEFAAAMAGLKVGASGPFAGGKDEVLELLGWSK